MRPVVRGEPPLDAEGCVKQFAKYQDARPDLLDRLGHYCSYCERWEGTAHIEHILPKNPNQHPELECEWSNMLLACASCNSHKNKQEIVIADYYWPDRDNTFRAFTYSEGGIVSVSPELAPDQRSHAQNTLALFGLDEGPGGPNQKTDDRWEQRNEAWGIAVRSRTNLTKSPSCEMRNQIVDTALATGYFSIWMTVFRDDTDMLRRFIEAFPGTSQDCFDDNGQPVQRLGGAL